MKVYVAGPVPEAGLKLLRDAGHSLTVCPDELGPGREQLLAAVADADGILPLLSSRIDAEVLARAPMLKAVANYAVGYDNVAVAEATRRGVVVTNTPDVLTDATAELALSLLLAAARRIPEAERFLRAGRFTGWSPNLFLGVGLTGKVLGLAGCGRIGQAVGRRARGLGLAVVYYDRTSHPAFEEETGARPVDKAGLLAVSDFLSLHLPLTGETRHFLSTPDFAAMKDTAILVNTSRGPVVDEAALARALAGGQIRAAGLDVFEEEPAVHPALLDLDNAVLVPHVGSATVETRGRMAEVAAYNLVEALAGRRPPNCVNPEVFGEAGR